MNSKYHTVAILPTEKFSNEVKDYLVDWNEDQQFIHYTLDDFNLYEMKKWKENSIT